MLHRPGAGLHFVDDAIGVLQIASNKEPILLRIVGEKDPQGSLPARGTGGSGWLSRIDIG